MTIPTPSPIWGDVTVTRSSAGSYVDGRWVAGATSTVTVRASMQPATADQLKRLPEGLRTSAAVAIYATTALQTANEASGVRIEADLVSWAGEDWEVQQVEHWGNYAPEMEHWRAIAVRATR